MGDPEHTEGETVELANPVRGSYRKVVVRDGVLVAAVLIGDLSPSACSPSSTTAVRSWAPRTLAGCCSATVRGREHTAFPTTPRSVRALESRLARSGRAPRSSMW